jgi:hypothetical protein
LRKKEIKKRKKESKKRKKAPNEKQTKTKKVYKVREDGDY